MEGLRELEALWTALVGGKLSRSPSQPQHSKPGSSSSYKPIDVVATPKPIEPHEWVTAKTKVEEMIALDKSRVVTNHPKASMRKRKYRFYLLVISTPYWLDQIKERVGHKKVTCRQVWSSRCVCARSAEFMGTVSGSCAYCSL